jgi:glycolate oxidase FAD binding subunit
MLNATLTLDGLTPGVIETPEDADALALILKEANAANQIVAPVGGGTMLELGAPLDRADIALSLTHLDRVIDYQPANLTVQCEAGITLEALNRLLAAQGQMLPLDPPFPSRATLGGILAANASGALRVRYGSARDLLIGMRAALADGSVIKGGGQVVKNVAGYDLPKLFIGSLGTLGVIVETTFKLVPIPRTRATIISTFENLNAASHTAQKILASPLLPMGIEILNRSATQNINAGTDPFTLFVRFGGIASAVQRQLSEVEKWSRDNGSPLIRVDDADDGRWSRLADFIYEQQNVVKVGVVPSEIPNIGARAEELAQANQLECLISANAVGVLYIAFRGDEARVAQAIAALRELARGRGGHLVIQRGSRQLRKEVGVWGPPRAEVATMHKLKEMFDPNRILNPGRFVDGI